MRALGYQMSSFVHTVLSLVCILACNHASAKTPQAAIADQIKQLQRRAETVEAKDALPKFAIAAKSIEAGYAYAALYDAKQPWADVVANEYLSTPKAKTFAEFEQEWDRQGILFQQLEKQFARAKLGSLPAAVRSLAQAAELQARTYYHAAKPFARDTDVDSGLSYIGVSSGLMDFALFCARLDFPRQRSTVGDVSPEIAQLDREILEAYDHSAEQTQARFNVANSLIKLAGELNQEKRFDGALKSYLDASIYLPAAPVAASYAKEKEEFRTRLAGLAGDNSIGRMYWELAQAETPSRAASIYERALPRYLAYSTAPHAATVSSTAPVVTVTLVRWPYT
jgi:hypothetical protein